MKNALTEPAYGLLVWSPLLSKRKFVQCLQLSRPEMVPFAVADALTVVVRLTPT